eukprot:scaffold154417_cov49-Prasinocladus_malaysianus.AAC.2
MWRTARCEKCRWNPEMRHMLIFTPREGGGGLPVGGCPWLVLGSAIAQGRAKQFVKFRGWTIWTIWTSWYGTLVKRCRTRMNYVPRCPMTDASIRLQLSTVRTRFNGTYRYNDYSFSNGTRTVRESTGSTFPWFQVRSTCRLITLLLGCWKSKKRVDVVDTAMITKCMTLRLETVQFSSCDARNLTTPKGRLMGSHACQCAIRDVIALDLQTF